MEKYVNLFTDVGFKWVFGQEEHKDVLLCLLNDLLREQGRSIKDLSYQNTEQQGRSQESRRAIYDLHCKSDEGEQFIIELQRARQNYFKDCALYYCSLSVES